MGSDNIGLAIEKIATALGVEAGLLEDCRVDIRLAIQQVVQEYIQTAEYPEHWDAAIRAAIQKELNKRGYK